MLRIGLLGCSTIAPISIIQPVRQMEKFQVLGVASREFKHAQAYADEHRIPKVYEDYEALLQDDEIDMVYIALANHVHKDWIIRAAQYGKPILVEKPICLNTAECKEIQAALEQTPVPVLEAVMVQHHPWQDEVKNWIVDQRYGPLKTIQTQISHPIRHIGNYRYHPEFGGGSLYDEGIYWLQFIQNMLQLSPISYQANSEFDGPNGCDWEFQVELSYASGVSAQFLSSFTKSYQASHSLIFERAKVTFPNFFRARLGEFKITAEIETFEGLKDKIVFAPQSYYKNQLQFFADVKEGKRPNIPLDQSFERIRWLEQLYARAKEAKHVHHSG